MLLRDDVRLLTFAIFAMLMQVPSAGALTMTDSLTAWRDSSAMERLQLATRFGRSFITLNEGFTADYFLKCIDDSSTYGNAKDAKIEDAMRACVGARMRSGVDLEDDE